MRKHPFIPSSVRRGPRHRALLSEFGRGQSWLRLRVSSAAGVESIRGLLRGRNGQRGAGKKEEKKTRSERGDIKPDWGPGVRLSSTGIHYGNTIALSRIMERRGEEEAVQARAAWCWCFFPGRRPFPAKIQPRIPCNKSCVVVRKKAPKAVVSRMEGFFWGKCWRQIGALGKQLASGCWSALKAQSIHTSTYLNSGWVKVLCSLWLDNPSSFSSLPMRTFCSLYHFTWHPPLFRNNQYGH